MAETRPRPSLFQYAIIYHPLAKKDEEPDPSILVVPLKTILAKDANVAALMAARSIPEEYAAEKLDRVEVAVRPF